MLLAFVVQGYFTQTHIHNPAGLAAISVLDANGSSRHDNNAPGNDDSNCAICQQIAHAGQFVVPAALLPFLIVLATSKVEIAVFAIPRLKTVAYTWRSRGPPQI